MILWIFFWYFWVIFAVRCLKITDFVSFPFSTYPLQYISGTNEYENFTPCLKGGILQFSILVPITFLSWGYNITQITQKYSPYGTVHFIYPYSIPQFTTLRYYRYKSLTILVINHHKNVFTTPPPVHMYIWWVWGKYFDPLRTPLPWQNIFMLTKITSGNW